MGVLSRGPFWSGEMEGVGAVLFLAWALSIIVGLWIGTPKGRATEGFVVPLIFGPIGVLLVAMLRSTPRAEAEWRVRVEDEMANVRSWVVHESEKRAIPQLSLEMLQQLRDAEQNPETETWGIAAARKAKEKRERKTREKREKEAAKKSAAEDAQFAAWRSQHAPLEAFEGNAVEQALQEQKDRAAFEAWRKKQARA